MDSATLHRQRRPSERHAPWVVLTAFGSLGTAVLAIAVDTGVLAEFEGFSAILRGYTLVGALLGLSSLVCCLLTFAYSLRKRALQEQWLLARGTLAAWLWAHVYFGVLAVVLALAHAGYGAFSLQLSTGKVLLLLLVILVGSGVVWRAIYAILPVRVARRLGNYSAQASAARAQASLVEIEKLAAGRSATFRQLSEWLLARAPSDAELHQATATLPAEEQPALADVARLSAARRDALWREREQKRSLRLLSGLRVVHVPVSLLLLLMLPVHVLCAYDVGAKAAPLGAVGAALGGFERSERCAECHQAIYDEWKLSMHAHAMKSPLMIAQTNQLVAEAGGASDARALQQSCVNCHGPIGAALTTQDTLPLVAGRFGDDTLLNDGISCAVCHQWNGETHPGGGGLERFQEGLEPGRTYFGPIADPVGNALHRSERGAVFQNPEQLCRNCHLVQLDKNGDGRHERGVDLVLQTLFDEWAAIGGGPSCLDCHMPATSRARAAEAALIPFEQDRAAPQRLVRDHTFVAVDYPLGDSAAREATRPRREALLRSAATLAIARDSIVKGAEQLLFAVEVKNSGTGHHLPGGFAFVRQLWLEVSVFDAAGKRIASSGLLARPTDDLCDASIVADPESPMRPFIAGCAAADPDLVNFQQMLVDKVEVARDAAGAPLRGSRGENLLTRAAGSKETLIQKLDGGPVPRLRPRTRQSVAPIPFGESATFAYSFNTGGAQAKRALVRLLFRTVPPYFLRALGKAQPQQGLERYLDSVEISEAARVEIEL